MRRRFVEANNRIARIVANGPNIDILQYFRSIMHNLGF